MYAVGLNQHHSIEELLRGGADPNLQMGDEGVTALHILAETSPAIIMNPVREKTIQNIMTLLLAYGANVDSRDTQGYTPLIRASQVRHYTTLRLLLENGANVFAESEDNICALSNAAWLGEPENIEELLHWGAGNNQKQLQWAFHATFWDYHEFYAMILIRAGLKIGISEAVMLVYLEQIYDERAWQKPIDIPPGKQLLHKLLRSHQVTKDEIDDALKRAIEYRLPDTKTHLFRYREQLHKQR